MNYVTTNTPRPYDAVQRRDFCRVPVATRKSAHSPVAPDDPDPVAWLHAIETENILQKKTPATARRQARLIQRRLITLDAQAWKMISERENEVVNQLLLAAAVKHSELLGDFMRNVYADRQRRLEVALVTRGLAGFLDPLCPPRCGSGWLV
jgi:hypothetical protein